MKIKNNIYVYKDELYNVNIKRNNNTNNEFK